MFSSSTSSTSMTRCSNPLNGSFSRGSRKAEMTWVMLASCRAWRRLKAKMLKFQSAFVAWQPHMQTRDALTPIYTIDHDQKLCRGTFYPNICRHYKDAVYARFTPSQLLAQLPPEPSSRRLDSASGDLLGQIQWQTKNSGKAFSILVRVMSLGSLWCFPCSTPVPSNGTLQSLEATQTYKLFAAGMHVVMAGFRGNKARSRDDWAFAPKTGATDSEVGFSVLRSGPRHY